MFHCIFTYTMQTGRGPTGWSETFWNNNSSADQARQEAIALAVLLRNVHSKNALMQGISVRFKSDDPKIRQTRRISYTPVNETLVQASGRLSGMYPTTALRLSVTSADARTNYIYLRGMPDGIDTEGNYTPPIFGWSTHINALLLSLQAANNGWARRQLVAANNKQAVTDITAAGLVTCPNHGYTVNDRVRIGQTISNPNIDKVYRVATVPSVSTFTVVGFPPVSADPQIIEASYAQLQFYEGVIITAAQANAVTKKNVGRPFGAPAGRQKTPKN